MTLADGEVSAHAVLARVLAWIEAEPSEVQPVREHPVLTKPESDTTRPQMWPRWVGIVLLVLPVEVHLGVAAAAARGPFRPPLPRRLGPKALQGSGRLKERAVEGEMLGGEEPAGLGLAAHVSKEL
jgi:hypothetical protein